MKLPALGRARGQTDCHRLQRRNLCRAPRKTCSVGGSSARRDDWARAANGRRVDGGCVAGHADCAHREDARRKACTTRVLNASGGCELVVGVCVSHRTHSVHVPLPFR
jgi:hypothetical protein